jgi:PAS domain S-box-containing protein
MATKARAKKPTNGRQPELPKSRLYDPSVLGGSTEAADFIANILEASTEYSMIGKELDGTIVLWNEGARRIYGYEPDEVIGKANSNILHTPEDLESGRPQAALKTALETGKWEGRIERVRKDGSRFTASVVITPRRDAAGKAIGYLLISKDVSDEIRLNRELEANQFYTRSLIESNIDALMTTDPVGVITDVNQQMELLTGHTREELIGTPFKNYFTEPERAEDGIRLVLREGKVTNYELTARAKDGRETIVSYNASTFLDRDNKLQGVFAAARDVTEHKGLEEQLRESQAYNRGLIESSVDGLVTVDPDGYITDVNEQMCRMADYTREELIGSPFAEYFADTDRAREGVSTTFARGLVTDYVLSLSPRGGGEILVSFNASVYTNEDGTVAGIFASARDITEQAHLQTQLASERGYNRGLIEASVDGLITVDPLVKITDVNDTMCRMAGYTRDELIGSDFSSYFTNPKHASEGVRLTFGQGSVTGYELTLQTRDGEKRLVSFNASVYKDEVGGTGGIFASARDVTDQAELQQQLNDERIYNRGLIEASVDGLVTVGEDLQITDVNETMCRMVGRSRTQLIGSSFPDYFTEPDRAREGVALTFSAGSVTNYVLTLGDVEGVQRPVSFNAAVFTDEAGAVRGIFASARDITEQEALQEQSADQQFYTRSLIESNIDALMTTDPVGVITDVNQQMELLTGHTREELIGTPFKNYFTEPERAEDGIRLVLREGKVTNYELTARAKDGRETIVSYNASTFLDRDNKLQGVFAAARDVTEHKGLEEQLRESQAYNRGLIESSVDGLVTVDPDGYITDVNEQMCRMADYTREELIGSPFAPFFTDPESARSGVAQTFANGVVTEYALTLVSRSRRELDVSFNASVYTDEDGTVAGIFASARDITDRVRLEEQLREQQTYLRGLIEASVDGLVTVDPEGFITDVNEQMCRMAGSTREGLIGSVFATYFTEPDRAERGVRQTLAEGIVTNYDLVLETRQGRRATVSFNASVFRGADGSLQGIFASARDVSEQARLQTELGQQQAYTRSLIEASADAQFAISADGVITDVNEEATRLTGYTRRHLVNSKFATYFTDPAVAEDGVAQTLAEGRALGYELVLVTRHGRKVTVSFNAGVFTDSAGEPLGVLAAARETTAQKELEERSADQQFYTRSLIESNIDALMTTDPVGVITDVNQQMELLTGHTREELIGTPFKNYFTEPDRAEDGIRLVLREGKVTNYELTARAKDGRETIVSYNASTFLDRDNKLQGVFAAARDVTERKRFDEQLQEKNDELEQASAAKDSFLANMSHELRTPLNAVIGFTGTLLMDLAGPLTEEQRGQLSIVQANAQHLLSLISDLLDLSRIEAGKMTTTAENVSCREVLEEVMSSLRPLAEAKSLALECALPRAAMRVTTDRRALRQILLNLGSNAIKFTEEGKVELAIEQRKNGVGTETVFSVHDTGIGIRTSDRERLFRAFEQIDEGSDRHYEGTGLGLYISQKLAALLNGELSVESTFGEGSTFAVKLRNSTG